MDAGRDKLLILDLDETLIYATEQPLDRECDFRVAHYYVYNRPHLSEFVRTCLSWFEVAVWTSSTPPYAAEVVARIFPDPAELAFIWASDRCSLRYDPELFEYYWRKNLKKLRRKGYAPERIIAVDDSPRKWETSYGNLVRVRPFEGDPADAELKLLLPYLCELRKAENIRTVEKRLWRSHR